MIYNKASGYKIKYLVGGISKETIINLLKLFLSRRKYL